MASIPKYLTAGDSWALWWANPAFESRVSHRLAVLVFNAGEVKLTATGTVVRPEGWAFNFMAADTAKLKSGLYRWSILIGDGPTRATVETGTTNVAPDPTGSESIEPKSPTRQLYEAALTTLFKLVSSEVSTTMFAGHQYTLLDIEKLQRVINGLELKLDAEDRLTGNIFFFRFRRI